ncbi:hypothetical protein CHARACLAT_020394 [Characodon lateralis]|uniref:Tubulin-specific chaperone E n=1 Tax=Characodon lateralis TaxID=208331 RepID=A0ABU7DTC8_9TELE|nr:hypothetical protein [Characodon lateralis]
MLNHCEVNGPGAAGEIRKTTPNVQWLDLSGSLVSRWEDVAAITEQLENLEGLQLSVNRISLTSDPWAHRRAFGNLKVLALNRCDITWLQKDKLTPANQHKMPPFTTEDFDKRLQKLAVLEMKIH